MKVIGVTGGVASGKSTVAAMLARLGAVVIDADAIGHELLLRPHIKDRIVSVWGDGLLDEQGELQRSKLAEVVFSGNDELCTLNRIVHPDLIEKIREDLDVYKRDGKLAVVIDAALLHEFDMDKLCDAIIFCEASEDMRVEYASRDRGWTRDEVRRREAFQLPLPQKKQKAGYVVCTDQSEEETFQQVRNILERINF